MKTKGVHTNFYQTEHPQHSTHWQVTCLTWLLPLKLDFPGKLWSRHWRGCYFETYRPPLLRHNHTPHMSGLPHGNNVRPQHKNLMKTQALICLDIWSQGHNPLDPKEPQILILLLYMHFAISKSCTPLHLFHWAPCTEKRCCDQEQHSKDDHEEYSVQTHTVLKRPLTNQVKSSVWVSYGCAGPSGKRLQIIFLHSGVTVTEAHSFQLQLRFKPGGKQQLALTSWTFPPRLGSGCRRLSLFSSWFYPLGWSHKDHWNLSCPWPGDPAHWRLTHTHKQRKWLWKLHKNNKHLLPTIIFLFLIHIHIETHNITHTVMQSLVTQYSWLTGRCWVTFFTKYLK